MIIKHKLEIDLVQQKIVPRLNTMQNDANSRALEISLLENGFPWEIPADITAALNYCKPDGTAGLYDTLPDGSAAYTISGNTVTIFLAPQVLTVPGLVRASVILTHNTVQIATFPLTILVEARPGAGAEKSENYYHYTSFDEVNDAIGNLADLKTEDKSSVVAAVNEIALEAGSGTVKSINGIEPDANGNVEIDAGEPGFSPTVIVNEITGGTYVHIRDQGGTKSAFIPNGKDGESVSVATTIQSTEDGGLNVVTFSDMKSIAIRNGRKGSAGYTPVKGVDYWTDADKQEILDELKAEQTGMLEIPLTEPGYMAGGDSWYEFAAEQEGAMNSGYVEIPEGYTHIKAGVQMNQWGWVAIFSTANGSGHITDPTISRLGGATNAYAEYLVEIPAEANYVMVSTYMNAESCWAYFTNADNEENTEEETPTDILDGTEFALFKQWGIVGDSLSVGHTADSDGNASSPHLDYSWGQYLARRIGNTCLNFGRSGISAKAWMTDDKGYNLLIQPEQLCQCYILALGANDADMTLGSIADVDFSNMENNADTEYGWYAKVINAIRTTAPQAPIFLFTLPYPRNEVTEVQAINGMIRAFASNENFQMVYLVDLDAEYNDYFKEGKLGNCIGNTGWHLTALGYLYASVVNEVAISKVMAEHPGDFQNVFEIPYGTVPTTETWVFTLEDGSTVSKDVMVG